MNRLLTGPRRGGRLLTAFALVLATGAAVMVAVPAGAARSTAATPRPCPVRPSSRPVCPPCPAPPPPPYYRLRPCPPVPEPQPGPTVPGVYGAKDFSAFVNRQPGATPTLIVTGTLTMASPGYGIRLVPTDPQGINPDILLLNLVVTPPTLFQAQVITDVNVRFEFSDFTGVSEVDILELALQFPVTTAR